MSNISKIEIGSMTLTQVVDISKQIKTIKDIYELSPPMISTLSKKHGEKKLVAIISLKINWLVDFLNIKNNMNEFQIYSTAEIICNKFNMLTISDIDLCFRMGISGEFGKIYNAIDGTVLIQWFEQYISWRSKEMEQYIHEDHNRRKFSGSNIHPTIVSEIKKVLVKKKDEKSNVKLQNILLPSDTEEKIWDEFDKMSQAQQIKIPGTNIPVVLYRGKHLSRDQFMVKRFDELLKNKK